VIVVLTEEPSMSVALRTLFKAQWPDRNRSGSFRVAFQTFADLLS